MTARTPSDAPESALVPLAVAAENLGVSVKTIRRRIADGTVRGYRVGRLIRVDLDELRQSLVVEMPTARSELQHPTFGRDNMRRPLADHTPRGDARFALNYAHDVGSVGNDTGVTALKKKVGARACGARYRPGDCADEAPQLRCLGDRVQ